jgi:hypothetical protein
MVYYVLGHLITLIEFSVLIIVLFFIIFKSKWTGEKEKTEVATVHVCGGWLLLFLHLIHILLSKVPKRNGKASDRPYCKYG